MKATAGHIAKLAHVVLCADLAQRREFKADGISRRSNHMHMIASRFMYDGSHDRTPGQYRGAVEDAFAIADGVWWDYMRPHIKKMLVDIWGADEKEAEKTIDKYFVDDSQQYDPTPRVK